MVGYYPDALAQLYFLLDLGLPYHITSYGIFFTLPESNNCTVPQVKLSLYSQND